MRGRQLDIIDRSTRQNPQINVILVDQDTVGVVSDTG